MPKNNKRARPSGASLTSASAPYSLASRDARSNSAKNSGQSASSAASANLIAPNTSLGQHFLKNPAVVTAIVAKAAIKPTDTVLEIGPGTGNMTVPLLAQSKNVIAIEYDPRMIREVLKRVEGTNDERKLQVVQGDAIKTRFPFFDVCVANVPYQISSALVFKLLSHRPMFRCAVMMFQEEFALRLTARPGEALYCRLSVNTQLLAKVDQLMKVGRNNFRPPPKVESRVVRIELRNPPPPVNFTEWDGMVRLLFNRKNKTLRSVLLTKPTIKLLNENMRTQRALNNNNKHNNNNHQGNSSSSSSMMMEVENVEAEEEKTADVIIEEVVAMEQWKDKRASKLDLDDFLALLAEFNKRGVHFA
jgi:18S rRNA (adenine1779-N6/adenine1780-N6)-dimethyltransferase